jgi:hypothetical protein
MPLLLVPHAFRQSPLDEFIPRRLMRVGKSQDISLNNNGIHEQRAVRLTA